jgi:carbon-monoxide dehydrogenase medium subunit
VLVDEFEYLEPETIPEAIDLLSKFGPDAKLIAGGTDLLLDMKMGKVKPKFLISLDKISDLRFIADGGETLRIGAMTTIAEIEKSKLIKDRCPLLSEAAQVMGSVQIRNMATIGGNICNALPSADLPPALVALDATVKVVGKNCEKTMPLEEFFAGVRKTKLEQSEILKEVQVRATQGRTGTSFLKLGKTHVDLAIVNAAARITLAKSGECKEARIAIGGGVAPTLIRARESEEMLEGRMIDENLFAKAAEKACEKLSPRETSFRASPWYKAEATKAIVKRALAKAFERARAGG